MKQTAFIHTNNKQILGAYLAKHAIESRLPKESTVTVSILNVDEQPVFKAFAHSEYSFTSDEKRTYNPEDLQSFTLSRFMPPELMEYEGKAIVIDPDIFALCNIEELFAYDLKGAAIGVCRKKDAWDTSVMLLDCAKLRHWSIAEILKNLRERTANYMDTMTLRSEKASICEIPRIWNHLDEYTEETKIIHMTGRLTQPWRTGLPIDFTQNKMKKILGVIPREPVLKLLGKYPSTYQKHPNPKIEALFFALVRAAMKDGAITKEIVQKEIDLKHVRPDIFEVLK